MNRRETALLAHLDAIEGRIAARFNAVDAILHDIVRRLGDIQADIAGMKIEHATHRHDDE